MNCAWRRGSTILLALTAIACLVAFQSCSTGVMRTLYIPANVKPDTVGPNYLHTVSQIKYWDRISPANRATNFGWWDSSGTVVEMSDYYNKVVVLTFFSTWSAPSMDQLSVLQRLYAQDTNILLLGVAMKEGLRGGEAVTRLDSIIRAQGFSFEVLVGSPDFGFTYGGIDRVPTTFVIDRERRLSATFEGLVSEQKLRAAIVAAGSAE